MDVLRLIQILKKEAECSVCLDTVKKPKTLPCLHSFCLQCLNALAQSARQRLQTTVNCPVCGTNVEIPEAEFANFPTSFHLNRLVEIIALYSDTSVSQARCRSCAGKNSPRWCCFDCHDLFCNGCIEVHNQMRISSNHRSVSIKNLGAEDVDALIRKPAICREQYHEKYPLEYYCRDCSVCICHKCGLLSHNGHSMIDIQKAAEEARKEIAEAVNIVKGRKAACEAIMEKGNELLSRGEAEITAAQASVSKTVEDVVQILKQQEKAAMTSLGDLLTSLRRAHATQQTSLQALTAQSQSSVEYCEGILTRDIYAEIVQSKDTVVKRCEHLSRQKITEIHKPLHVSYVANFELIDSVQRYGLGQVAVSLTDPSQSLAERKRLREAKLGEEANFGVKTRDSDGKQFYFASDQVTVKIQNSGGECLSHKISDNKDGLYLVKYTPEMVGSHGVEILVNGQPLTGSPFTVVVSPHQYKAVCQFGSYGKGEHQFDRPYHLAVNDNGTIAVADYRNKRIQMFRSDGKHIRSFCPRTTGSKKIGAPDSLAFTSSGNIFVVHSKMISRFTKKGEFIKHVTSDHLKDPFSISQARDGLLIVCDKGDNTIKIVCPERQKIVQSFCAPDCPSPPWFAVCHDNKTFASYAESSHVKVFNMEGKFLYNIGRKGIDEKHINFPVGLAVDRFNNLIVCDYNNGTLKVFTLDGTFVGRVDTLPSDAPYSIAVSGDGLVFVSDISAHCVHVFR